MKDRLAIRIRSALSLLPWFILQLGTPIILHTAQRRSKVEKAVGKLALTTQKRRRNKYSNAIVIPRPSSSFRLNVRQVPCIPPVQSGVVEHFIVWPLLESLSFFSCLCLTRTLTHAFPWAARELKSPHDHHCILICILLCISRLTVIFIVAAYACFSLIYSS